jgi:hypothetical protein
MLIDRVKKKLPVFECFRIEPNTSYFTDCKIFVSKYLRLRLLPVLVWKLPIYCLCQCHTDTVHAFRIVPGTLLYLLIQYRI